jgi:hypothetical protein
LAWNETTEAITGCEAAIWYRLKQLTVAVVQDALSRRRHAPERPKAQQVPSLQSPEPDAIPDLLAGPPFKGVWAS